MSTPTIRAENWTEIKDFVVNRNAFLMFFERDNNYELYAFDRIFIVNFTLTRQPEDNTDLLDFETNFKPSANQTLGNFEFFVPSGFAGERRLKVQSLAAPGGGISSIPIDETVDIPEDLKLNGTGDNNMGVDGDAGSGNKEFFWQAPAGEIWYATGLSIVLIDPGSMDITDLGSVPKSKINNGVLLEMKLSGTVFQIRNFKNNVDVAHYFAGSSGFSGDDDGGTAFLDEDDQFRGFKVFDPPLIMRGDSGDFVKATVRDDIDGVQLMCLTLHKWRVI